MFIDVTLSVSKLAYRQAGVTGMKLRKRMSYFDKLSMTKDDGLRITKAGFGW